MKKFDLDKLKLGDIVAVRSTTTFGDLIRAVLGSWTNHNGLIVKHLGDWKIAEAVSPVSKVTPLSEYEAQIAHGAYVQVWRVPEATDKERFDAAKFAVDNLLGKKYPLSVARLWVYRFVNQLPWRIKGEWCTRLVWDAWGHIDPGIFDRPDGKRKLNPTPRTFENRLAAGVIRDVTHEVLV